MEIKFDQSIDPRSFNPTGRLMVYDIDVVDLLTRKENGSELTLKEFAVIVLIEASRNA
ncbi:hypothetical protein AAY80_037 [Stenotrophomonas phage vB_SmaS-DLP_6]|nr:hypothetical protein AAY80_037 [Stenotrophomonas phage vB_SmaS-DLP_6]